MNLRNDLEIGRLAEGIPDSQHAHAARAGN